MTETKDYGRYYWCVKVPKTVSKDGEIYVYADQVRVLPSGVLECVAQSKDGIERMNLGLAPGQWTAIYAASVMDGSAVAVEHWSGEVSR